MLDSPIDYSKGYVAELGYVHIRPDRPAFADLQTIPLL